MEKIVVLFKKITLRQWGTLYALTGAAILAAVFISQYGFNFQPCKLCIWQRMPYAAVLALGALMVFTDNQKIAKALLFLIGVACLFNAGLAFFHMGVEYKWWEFASDCTGSGLYKPDATVEEMLAALKAAPNVRCDERLPFLFGMTMAFYNVIVSAVLGIVALLALVSSLRRMPQSLR
jgi:disulfide bond formation protein DsbB